MQKDVSNVQLGWDLLIFTGLKAHHREPNTTAEPPYMAVLQPTDQDMQTSGILELPSCEDFTLYL